MKKIIYFVFIFIFIVSNISLVLAQRNSSRSSSRKTTTRTSGNTNQSIPTQPITNTNEVVGEKFSCEEMFNFCMDTACLDKNKIRYNCLSSLDTFEKVLVDGEQIRIGSDLYTYARGECITTLRGCELSEQNSIETNYKAKIQEDALTRNYFLAMNAASDETVQAVYQEYVACMTPLCGPSFTDCFSIKNVERRAPNCESILTKTSKPFSVKKRLYEELQALNKKLCSGSGGYVDYDTKKCKINVTYGGIEIARDGTGAEYPTGRMGKPVKTLTFNVGEMVECTEEYFNTSNRERVDLEKKVIDVGAAVTKTGAAAYAMAGGIVSVAGGTVSTPFTAGAGTVAGIYVGQDMIRGSTGHLVAGVGEILTSVASLLDTERAASGCFINNQMVSEMGMYFTVNFMQ